MENEFLNTNQPDGNESNENIVDFSNRKVLRKILKDEYDVNDGKIEKKHLLKINGLRIDFSTKKYDINPPSITLDVDFFKDFEHLDWLQISGENLKRIKLDTFNNLANLERLSITSCGIEALEVGIFKSLTSLKELTIYNTQLTKLVPSLFFGLDHLEILSLESNQISELGVDSFKGLSHLLELDLSHNPIASISSKAFSGLINLQQLNLTSTLVNDISPNTFVDLYALKTLDLSRCKLNMVLHQDMFKGLNSLDELLMNSNEIKRFSKDCCKALSNLKLLDLSFNHISQIKKGDLDHLCSLQILNLEVNRIKHTIAVDEGTFKDLEQLKELNLSQDRVISFDREYLGLSDKTNVSWRDEEKIVNFYKKQNSEVLEYQNRGSMSSGVIPHKLLYRLIGANKVQLIKYVKYMSSILLVLCPTLIIFILTLPKEFITSVLSIILGLVFGYSFFSILIFSLTYRSQVFKAYELRYLSEFPEVNREFIVEAVAKACKEHNIEKTPEITITTNNRLFQLQCDVIGMSKHKFFLYINESILWKLTPYELEELISKKIQDASTLTMPINTIFRGGWSPFSKTP